MRNKYMKKIKKIVGIIVVVFIAFIYAHIAKTNNIYDKNVDSSEYIGTGVVFEGTIEQRFTCVEDTLDGVKVKAQIFGDVQNVQVVYLLIDNQTGEIVADGKVEASEIQSGKFFECPFSKIENCKDKEYTIVFENINAAENTGIGFYFQSISQKGTKLTISENSTEGTLILKTITDRFDCETFIVLLIFIVYIVAFMRFLYKLFE